MLVSGGKIRIICSCCDGKGMVPEKGFPAGDKVVILCPVCNGRGFMWAEEAFLETEFQSGRVYTRASLPEKEQKG